MIQITYDEIKEVYEKFKILNKKYPDLVEDVSFEEVKKVADYLNDPEEKYNEYYAWQQMAKGNFYGFSILLHEKSEIQVLEDLIAKKEIRDYKHGNDIRRTDSHGKALVQQYLLLQEYIKQETGIEYTITSLCYADSWDENRFDEKNAKTIIKYLKKYDLLLYNKVERYPWQKNYSLKLLMKKIREESQGETL